MKRIYVVVMKMHADFHAGAAEVLIVRQFVGNMFRLHAISLKGLHMCAIHVLIIRKQTALKHVTFIALSMLMLQYVGVDQRADKG
jgi:hypothetical protein